MGCGERGGEQPAGDSASSAKTPAPSLKGQITIRAHEIYAAEFKADGSIGESVFSSNPTQYHSYMRNKSVPKRYK